MHDLEQIQRWMQAVLMHPAGVEQGLASEAARQATLATFGFEPGDIVTSVMSFGSSTPIAVRIVGTDLKLVRAHAEKIAAAITIQM